MRSFRLLHVLSVRLSSRGSHFPLGDPPWLKAKQNLPCPPRDACLCRLASAVGGVRLAISFFLSLSLSLFCVCVCVCVCVPASTQTLYAPIHTPARNLPNHASNINFFSTYRHTCTRTWSRCLSYAPPHPLVTSPLQREAFAPPRTLRRRGWPPSGQLPRELFASCPQRLQVVGIQYVCRSRGGNGKVDGKQGRLGYGWAWVVVVGPGWLW
jgi:hypothetical protein